MKGGLKGLVIGHVLTCVKHPNADKLSITTVDVGQDKPLNIVCGASNVAAGQKVIVAVPGTTIHPTKGEPFTIKSAKIRGEASEGMICAEDEIGLGENHAGIIVLPENTTIGKLASAYYNIQSDYIFEIGLTPNRADAASHIGVARDIKASKGRTIKWPSIDHFKIDNTSLTIPVSVENIKACPRYSAITLSGIKVAESPEWLKNRLLSIGLSPINNIVDITNFICHEIGQPLHSFDADQIEGHRSRLLQIPGFSRRMYAGGFRGPEFVAHHGHAQGLQALTLALALQRCERAFALLLVEGIVDRQLAALALVVDFDGVARRCLVAQCRQPGSSDAGDARDGCHVDRGRAVRKFHSDRHGSRLWRGAARDQGMGGRASPRCIGVNGWRRGPPASRV